MSARANLSEGVLRQLMRQVGLPESGSADPAQLLRRIDQLGRSDASESCGSCSDEGDSNDGYDTVCDEDETSSVGESEPDVECDVSENSGSPACTGRNNNGTQRLRQSDCRLRRRQRQRQELDDDKLEVEDGQDRHQSQGKSQDKDTYAHEASTTAAADGVESLQIRMDGVVLSVIEGLHGAVQSLLKLHEGRINGEAKTSDRLESVTSLVPPSTQSYSSQNVSSNCRGDSRKRRAGGLCSRKARAPLPPEPTKPPKTPPPKPCEAAGGVGDRAGQLLKGGPPDVKFAARWQRQLETAASELPTADHLARRLESLELLLLSFMQQQQLRHGDGGIDSRKLAVMHDLKRSLGCLQAQLLQLQARELSQGVHEQHRRLDRTWNFRRDWRQVPRAAKRAPDAMLACALGDPASSAPIAAGAAAAARNRRPARGDRWLLKFLPRAQRRALPLLMRTAGSYELIGSSSAAVAAASALTRARGRPLVACRHLRDPRDDVIRKFVYALQQ